MAVATAARPGIERQGNFETGLPCSAGDHTASPAVNLAQPSASDLFGLGSAMFKPEFAGGDEDLRKRSSSKPLQNHDMGYRASTLP
jgi:hypothetical protein